MLKRLKNHQAQANITEYVVIIFIVVGMMTAMGVFVKRALQGRIFDARNYAVKTIKDMTKGDYNGNVFYAYEPYYAETVSLIKSGEMTDEVLSQGGASRKNFNSETMIMTNSETAPPKEAD